MAMREPLPGWVDNYLETPGTIDVQAAIPGTAGTWWLVGFQRKERHGESGSPRIAAEDAARAMVADMAKALGGSVTWATEGGE